MYLNFILERKSAEIRHNSSTVNWKKCRPIFSVELHWIFEVQQEAQRSYKIEQILYAASSVF